MDGRKHYWQPRHIPLRLYTGPPRPALELSKSSPCDGWFVKGPDSNHRHLLTCAVCPEDIMMVKDQVTEERRDDGSLRSPLLYHNQ